MTLDDLTPEDARVIRQDDAAAARRSAESPAYAPHSAEHGHPGPFIPLRPVTAAQRRAAARTARANTRHARRLNRPDAATLAWLAVGLLIVLAAAYALYTGVPLEGIG